MPNSRNTATRRGGSGRGWALGPTLLLLVGLIGACGGGGTKGGAPPASSANTELALPAAQLALVAYSTPQDAYDQITDAFSGSPRGKNVRFTKSFGGSGDQSRAVESGLPADYVAFSLEPDMNRLARTDVVAAGWNAGPDKGMVTRSVVVFVVRKGNPRQIRTWNDLTKPGVEVITPNPFTSGGARWNVMAAYGQAVKAGGSEAEAATYLNNLFKNVAVQDDSARKSLQTFTSGKGDVLIAYENEAIFAQQKDQPIDYVVPDATILIENPAAITKTSKNPEQAQAFLDYVRGPQAQQIFADNGYRPVNPQITRPAFPTPTGLFTIADFGGWSEVTKKFFDPAGSIMADVEHNVGVSVG